MRPNPWNQPLPPEIILGGVKRFSDPVPDPFQTWVISKETGRSTSLRLDCRTKESPLLFSLLSTYSELSPESPIPSSFIKGPILDNLDWDWIEFHYKPLNHIQVKVIHWVPDLRVVCGTHRIHNTGPHRKEIYLRLSCQGESGKTGFRFSRESHQGRRILIGSSPAGNSVLLLTGSETQNTEPSNHLVSPIGLEPGEVTVVKWLLVNNGPETDSRHYLNKVLQLDWEGEIGRRRVALSSQLQIKTGEEDQDLTLALSQRLARLILNQRILQAENSDPNILPLDPLQAWQLSLALEPLDSSNLKWLLRSVLQEQTGPGLPFPLGTALLWHSHQRGLDPDFLRDLLPVMTEDLQSWFSLKSDRDGDGIAEEPPGGLFHLERYSDQANCHDGLLETPGSAALLHNEINHLGKLEEELLGIPFSSDFHKQLSILENFILDAWGETEKRFQSRNYLNHQSYEGYSLLREIQNGWNIIDEELLYPSHLKLRISAINGSDQVTDLSISLQGVDWQGRYRIEELTLHDILWHDSGGWGTTKSVFSYLEHCVVLGLKSNQHILVKVPGSDCQDLSHTLPLWLDGFSGSRVNEMISKSLAEGADFWSLYGFKTYPLREKSPVQLPLNLLVCQGLIKTGQTELAGKAFFHWLKAATLNITGHGCLYSSWDPRTGSGMGKANLLESLLPFGLVLDLLGLRFLVNGNLLIQERAPAFYPISVEYRGIRIKIDQKETILTKSGGGQEVYPRGKEVVISF